MHTLLAFQWSFVWEHRDDFAAGLEKTLKISAIAIAGAFGIGVLLGAARAHRIPVLNALAAVYVEVIRNTPILV
jgi:His/Glu/Gln/Arg/opine family amino acid ABC transporter permease subunit